MNKQEDLSYRGLMTRITLPDHKAISWNKIYAQGHWTTRKKLVDEVHFRVKIACKGIGLINGRVSIMIIADFKTRPLDSSNIAAKLYEDGLIKAGIIKDDSPEHVRMVSTESRPKQEKDQVHIFITPLI